MRRWLGKDHLAKPRDVRRDHGREAGQDHGCRYRRAEREVKEDVDEQDVDEHRHEHDRGEQCRASKREQDAAGELYESDDRSVNGRVAEVVPRQPLAGDVTHRPGDLRVERRELRAGQLRAGIEDTEDRGNPSRAMWTLHNSRLDDSVSGVVPVHPLVDSVVVTSQWESVTGLDESSRVTSHESRVTSHESRVASELP